MCATVFSAPNYCDQVGNLGAILRFKHEGEQASTQSDIAEGQSGDEEYIEEQQDVEPDVPETDPSPTNDSPARLTYKIRQFSAVEHPLMRRNR